MRLGDVRDLTRGMGEFAGRRVEMADPAAWVRSALQILNEDRRINLVSEDPTALELRVEILKAYVQSSASTRAATVVIRIEYYRGAGAHDEQLYRGSDQSVNWIGEPSETTRAVNRALGRIVESVRADLLTRCGSGSTLR